MVPLKIIAPDVSAARGVSLFYHQSAPARLSFLSKKNFFVHEQRTVGLADIRPASNRSGFFVLCRQCLPRRWGRVYSVGMAKPYNL